MHSLLFTRRLIASRTDWNLVTFLKVIGILKSYIPLALKICFELLIVCRQISSVIRKGDKLFLESNDLFVQRYIVVLFENISDFPSPLNCCACRT